MHFRPPRGSSSRTLLHSDNLPYSVNFCSAFSPLQASPYPLLRRLSFGTAIVGTVNDTGLGKGSLSDQRGTGVHDPEDRVIFRRSRWIGHLLTFAPADRRDYKLNQQQGGPINWERQEGIVLDSRRACRLVNQAPSNNGNNYDPCLAARAHFLLSDTLRRWGKNLWGGGGGEKTAESCVFKILDL